jgi:hypothetical protein
MLRIFGPKRDEVAGGCNKMHNEEFHNLYPSPSTIIKMRWAGHVVFFGEKRNSYQYGISVFRKARRKEAIGNTKTKQRVIRKYMLEG